jgi:hypothetical protein
MRRWLLVIPAGLAIAWCLVAYGQAIGALSGRTSGVAQSDTTPNAFSFADQTDVQPSTTITSGAITVSGTNAAAAITVTGGTYDINASGSFTSDAGTVNNGDTVRARHTSSGSNSTATNTAVTIGGVSDTFTSTTVADGSGDGFTPESGFDVTTLTSFAHGEEITITRSSGAWEPRTYGTTPWLWDTCAEAYQAGTLKTPMSVFSDTDLVTVAPSNAVWGDYGRSDHRIRLAESTGSRDPPNDRTECWWYSTTGVANMKMQLSDPIWPSGWNGGTQNNQKMLMIWGFRHVESMANNAKYNRFNHIDGVTGVGSHQFNPTSFNAGGRTMWDTGPQLDLSTWGHLELFIDLDNNTIDGWAKYRYVRDLTGSSSLGRWEYRSTTPFDASSNPGGYLFSSDSDNGGFTAAWTGITMAVGADGQTSDHAGQEFDIANVYVDADFAHPVIGDCGTWDVGPTTGNPREVQGRWERVSDTVMTLHINQGQFASLSGKCLWYRTNPKEAVKIGEFD